MKNENSNGGLKSQFSKIKENWLMITLFIVALVVFSGIFNRGVTLFGSSSNTTAYNENMAYDSISSYRGGATGKMISPQIAYDSGSVDTFYMQNRKITKNSSISNEVERGKFSEAEAKLKSIINLSNSLLLSENVNTYKNGNIETKNGYYSIKVEADKYSSIITQLKEIGKVTSFNENATDITQNYVNTQVELEVERNRLTKYQELYSDINRKDQIDLIDRIFNQERTIKYLEDSLKNQDKQVVYSDIYLTINEKQSDWISITLVKLSELVRSFVNSVNSLLKLIMVILPYAVVIGLVWFIVHKIRNR
ncbi:MAG: DUF4349 domain-containing protein [archaeon]